MPAKIEADGGALAYKYNIPIEIVESLKRYINHRIPTGGFLHAVLSNDLRESCARADWVNKHCIFDITSFCWNELPAISWGSYEKVDEWLKKKS